METLERLLDDYIEGKLDYGKRAYFERCINNLSKKSENKVNLSEISPLALSNDIKMMINEWQYKDNPDNYRIVKNETCQLCNRIDNVYQYRIVNVLNNNEMWIGSSCIQRFYIKVYDVDNNIITDNSDRNKILSKTKLTEKERISTLNIFIEKFNGQIYSHDNCGKYILKLNYDNLTKGIYSINQIKYIALKYKQYKMDESINEGFIPQDIIRLFKIDLKNPINKKDIKSPYFTAFHFVQFEPILTKVFYRPNYGFDNKSYLSAIEIYRKHFYTSQKEFTRILRKFSGGKPENFNTNSLRNANLETDRNPISKEKLAFNSIVNNNNGLKVRQINKNNFLKF